MTEYDIIVIGGGHNGLTAAAYFAVCGFRTVVVEKNSRIGGGVYTHEPIPGVKMDLHSYLHAFIQGNPMIKDDEIGLVSKFGLSYVYHDQMIGNPSLNGSSIILYRDVRRTMKNIEKINPKDAAAYGKMMEWIRPMVESSVKSMFEPPQPAAVKLAQMESSPEGREVLQLSYLDVFDIVDEWFEDAQLKVLLTKLGSDWTVYHPKEAGNAMFLINALGFMHYVGWGIPIGGSGELSEALARCIRAYGGDIITGDMVDQIIVRNTAAVGVRTQRAKTLVAKKAVVADLNVKQIPKLCGEENFSTSYLRQINRLLHAYSAGALEWVLKDYPKFSADPTIANSYEIVFAESIEDILSVYDGIAQGLPEWTQPHFSFPTLFDPSRAPAGVHTMNMWLPEPYELKDGGAEKWDEVKDGVAQKAYENLRKYAPNMTDEVVIYKYFHSPLDFERWNPSFIRGDEGHIAVTLGQQESLRPLPGFGDFTTPIQNLYLCGPSTHIGGGVTGQARAAAKAIINWLDKDFERLIADSRDLRS